MNELVMHYPYKDGWRKYINEDFEEYYERLNNERPKQKAFNFYFDMFCEGFDKALEAIDKGEDNAWKKALQLLRRNGIREIMYNIPEDFFFSRFTEGRRKFQSDLEDYVYNYEQELLRRIERRQNR